MAAVALKTSQTDAAKPVTPEVERPATLGRLVKLHAEAEETARLANLLGRSLYALIALPLIATLTIGLADTVDLARQLVWCVFIGTVSLAMLSIYARAIRKPFDRTGLREFARDLSPILLFGGFAWGAGAFLALPEHASTFAAILFAAVPAVVIAALLREREAVFLFLAPVAALASVASFLRPFAESALAAAGVLIASAAIAAIVVLLDRRRAGELVRPAMLSLT